jgi:hypothetical protein
MLPTKASGCKRQWCTLVWAAECEIHELEHDREFGGDFAFAWAVSRAAGTAISCKGWQQEPAG